ncbi:MAG: restriction endonuclease subunit S [Firmicutes bacterium]|nr:restriction endonuclease subunit S [Bacillota bacterium]
MDEKKLPQIRLSGFTGEWETTKLGDVTERVTRKNSNMESTLPLTISAQHGLVDQISFFNSQVASQNISNYYLLMNGEFAYNKSTSQDYPVGAVKRLDRYDMGVLSTLYILFKPREEVSSDYLVTYFDSDYWHKEIKLRAAEGARNHGLLNISPDDFFDIDINVPKDINEQQAIGILLQRVDVFVSQRRAKLEKLQALRSSMLEKMFPRDGADIPEIRFKGFTEGWKEYSFENITFPAGTRNSDNIQYESYSITNEAGFVPQNEQFSNGGTMKDADKRMYIIVEPNSFTYNPARINVGSIGYQHLDHNVIVSSLYEVFKTTGDCHDRFLWYWFKTKTFRKMIEQLQEGGVRLYFYYDKLCMCSIKMPNIAEQTRIAEYFEKLDELIFVCSKELDKLQSLKKGLLGKMFV